MIRIENNFEKYCEKCPDLDIYTHLNTLLSGDEVYEHHIIVECMNKDRCKQLYNQFIKASANQGVIE